MHSRQDLKKITTIVYTASENSADKGRALTTGANAYLTKGPDGLKDLVVYVKLVIATLPPPKE
jgi:CheY-like chemotaxis protein